MKKSRMLVLMLLVVITTVTPVATSAAYASGLDTARDFAYYLMQYYWE